MAQPEQRVGEYVLEERIGRGTFGEVWRARHHVWADQLAAVKIPTDPQYVRSLQREGVAIHGLVHPNIVRALGFDPYAQTPYLVMELVPGTNLRSLISSKSITPPDAVLILRQILSGVAYAHERGIVHRDIKPENILIHERAAKAGYAEQGVVKVTDFGLGRAATETAVGSIAYTQSLDSDAARKIAGTLDYMSPEQRSGGAVDGRSDLYACGVVLFEMLTGEKPAGTEVPSDLNAAVPAQLDTVFRRSYTRLEKRYASAAEMLAALNDAPAVEPKTAAPKPAIDRTVYTPAGVARSACPNCRQHVDPTDQFCMHCGLQLVATVRRCKECGGFPGPSDHFCIFCGQPVDASPDQPASPVVPYFAGRTR